MLVFLVCHRFFLLEVAGRNCKSQVESFKSQDKSYDLEPSTCDLRPATCDL